MRYRSLVGISLAVALSVSGANAQIVVGDSSADNKARVDASNAAIQQAKARDTAARATNAQATAKLRAEEQSRYAQRKAKSDALLAKCTKGMPCAVGQ